MAKDVKSVEYGLEKIFEGAQDFLPLLGTDYVEFYVGNAKQSAHYYKTAFGYQSHAYRGLETGSKDSVSYVLKQDKIRLVLTTPLTSSSPINEHLAKHGDGVKVIALWVEDARSAWEETTKRGAWRSCPFRNPYLWRNGSHLCRKKKLQRSLFTRFCRMEIRVQSGATWIKICRPYGRECRLG